MENTIKINVPTTADIKQAITEVYLEFEKKKQQSKLLTKNEFRKIVHIGYEKINELIENGTIKTTSDGKYITEYELNKYLGMI